MLKAISVPAETGKDNTLFDKQGEEAYSEGNLCSSRKRQAEYTI
jgi:hypothetical protein